MEYVTQLGFISPRQIPTKNDSSVVLAYHFEGFDAAKVRAGLGRHHSHTPDGVFVFRMSADRAARINVSKQTLLLVSGRDGVRALLKTVKKQHAKEKTI